MLTKAERRELNRIIVDTASLGGSLRQFEMATSKAYQPSSVEEQIQSLQEHAERLYGMVQRVCAILLEDE